MEPMGEDFRRILTLVPKESTPDTAWSAEKDDLIVGEIATITNADVFSYVTSTRERFVEFAGRYQALKDRIKTYQEDRKTRATDVLKGIGIPLMFINAKKDDFPSKIWDMAKMTGTYIYGLAGTGKTHLAVAMLREFLETATPKIYCTDDGELKLTKVKRPRFVSVTEILLEIRSSFNRQDGAEGMSEMDVIDHYTDDRLTVFDDLGVEKVSDFTLQTLYTIIDRRYRNICPTIITSNLNPEQLAHRLGDRIASRIVGMCAGVLMTGHDRRYRRTTP